MELVLGTVQFGMPYGIAGRDRAMSDGEVREVLSAARAAGIRVLDTAAAYGDIEPRLAGLMEPGAFEVASKVPPIPADLDPAGRARFVREAAARSRERLGEALRWLMFHRAEDLLGDEGQALWTAAQQGLAGVPVAIGVSGYEDAVVRQARERLPLALAQLPANALDQRLADVSPPGRMEWWMRSAFLQGALLMPLEQALVRLPAAALPLRRWHAWCAERGLPALQAALSLAKGFAAFDRCVVGVDSTLHLEQIVAAWDAARPLRAPDLRCDDLDVIDPRRWSRA